MKTRKFKCCCCRRIRELCVPGQKYCNAQECQKTRKNKWRRQAYTEDIDYRNNQKDSTDSWLESQGGAALYHREYRRKKREESLKQAEDLSALSADKSPIVDEKKSEDQEVFTGEASRFAEYWPVVDDSANSDVVSDKTPITSGVYRLFCAHANSDTVIVKISVISDT